MRNLSFLCMRVRGSRRLRYSCVGAFVLSGIVVYVVWFGFPPTSRLRSQIAEADRVELRAFVGMQPSAGVDLVIVSDKRDLQRLAASVKVLGPPLPLDTILPNSYRIRCVSAGEVVDIVIRGRDHICEGNWSYWISTSLMDTFRTLVEESGRTVPSSREVIRLLKAEKARIEGQKPLSSPAPDSK